MFYICSYVFEYPTSYHHDFLLPVEGVYSEHVLPTSAVPMFFIVSLRTACGYMSRQTFNVVGEGSSGEADHRMRHYEQLLKLR